MWRKQAIAPIILGLIAGPLFAVAAWAQVRQQHKGGEISAASRDVGSGGRTERGARSDAAGGDGGPQPPDDLKVITGIASAVGAVVSAIVSGIFTFTNSLITKRSEERRDREKLLLEYVSPLRSAAEALAEKFGSIESRVGGGSFKQHWFMDIKNLLISDDAPGEQWIAKDYQPVNGKIVNPSWTL
jgi:hypothetical protein